MCKASDGIYKKHQEQRYGIKVCKGKLKDTEIDTLLEDIELINYILKTKNFSTSCNINKLIENLT